MRRFLSLALLALVLTQAMGLAFPAEPDGCSESCPGEEQNGQCPPDCDWCACCPGARLLLAAPLTPPPAPERSEIAPEEPSFSPSTPDPHEIFHVPRLPA
jgi:hypothetical protein